MKNIKYLFVSLSLISLFSCADFLDRDPKGVMDQDRFFFRLMLVIVLSLSAIKLLMM